MFLSNTEDISKVAFAAHNSYGADKILNSVYQLNSKLLALAAFSITFLAQLAASIGNLAFQIFLYFTLVFLLVSSQTSILDYMLAFLPKEPRLNLKQDLQAKISGVFTSQLESALYQAVFTWMLLDYAKV